MDDREQEREPTDRQDAELERTLRAEWDECRPDDDFADRLEARLRDELRRRAADAETAPRRPRTVRTRTLWPAAAAAAAILIVIALGVLKSPERRSGRMVLSDEEAARLETEIHRLDAEARQRMAAVELMELRGRLADVERRLAATADSPDPDVWIRTETERTAAALVAGADRMANEFNLIESAADLYRRAIELFPDSRGAEIARRRLVTMQPG